MQTIKTVPVSVKEIRLWTDEVRRISDEMRVTDYVFTWEDVISQALEMFEDEKGKVAFDRCLNVSYRSLKTSVFDLRD